MSLVTVSVSEFKTNTQRPLYVRKRKLILMYIFINRSLESQIL